MLDLEKIFQLVRDRFNQRGKAHPVGRQCEAIAPHGAVKDACLPLSGRRPKYVNTSRAAGCITMRRMFDVRLFL